MTMTTELHNLYWEIYSIAKSGDTGVVKPPSAFSNTVQRMYDALDMSDDGNGESADAVAKAVHSGSAFMKLQNVGDGRFCLYTATTESILVGDNSTMWPTEEHLAETYPLLYNHVKGKAGMAVSYMGRYADGKVANMLAGIDIRKILGYFS